MTIFCDAHLPEPALALLKEGTTEHRLVFPARLSTSVLAQGEADPALAEAEVLFGQPDAFAAMNSPKVRWLHITSAGYTRYDTAAFRQAVEAGGFAFTNSSTVYAHACAEHVLAFLLAQARVLPRALSSRAESGSPEWLGLREAGHLLPGARVVILGYGAIAARLVQLLAPFEMEISALRRQPRGGENVRIFIHEALCEELAQADHVIDILPENEGTRGFVSHELLQQMKPGAAFYNIGRGATVDQEALAEALRTEHLSAAWLDVTSPEPLPEGHELLSLANCYITPHTAGGQSGEAEGLVRHFLANLRRFEKGEALLDRVF